MKVSAISQNDNDSKRNFFIRYSNSFMSAIHNVNPIEKAGKINSEQELSSKSKKMGIENLQEFTIFPKEVVDGRTIITA